MPFQPDPDRITWKLHVSSPPEAVFDALDTDRGRAAYWAESAVEGDGAIAFEFINGLTHLARILKRERPQLWSIDYFGSMVEISLEPDGSGGTDMTLVNTGVRAEDRTEVTAGWLNVLLPLKAWVDFGVDLRTHDPTRTWDAGYVDQ